MADYGSFAVGGATFPLVNTTTNTLLQDADPALATTIDYFKSVLTTYLNDRFATEISRASVTTMSQIVQTTAHFDVSPYLPQFLQGFPILSVFRQTSKITRKTHAWMHIESKWGVQLIFAPLKIPAQPWALWP